MIVKYLINENKEVLTDRSSLQKEFNLSKTKLHHIISKVDPSLLYRGSYLYKYDEVKDYLKKNVMMGEVSD